MAREVRCNGCRTWYRADSPDCPGCGQERPHYNRSLHVASLNSALYQQAEASLNEEKSYRRSVAEEIRQCRRYGIEPGTVPSKEVLSRELASAAPAAH